MSERESVFKCIYEDWEECWYVILNVCLVNLGRVLSAQQQPTTENREAKGDTGRRELTQGKANFQTYCMQWKYVGLVTLRSHSTSVLHVYTPHETKNVYIGNVTYVDTQCASRR